MGSDVLGRGPPLCDSRLSIFFWASAAVKGLPWCDLRGMAATDLRLPVKSDIGLRLRILPTNHDYESDGFGTGRVLSAARDVPPQ